jgi:hypothetical protein
MAAQLGACYSKRDLELLGWVFEHADRNLQLVDLLVWQLMRVLDRSGGRPPHRDYKLRRRIAGLYDDFLGAYQDLRAEVGLTAPSPDRDDRADFAEQVVELVDASVNDKVWETRRVGALEDLKRRADEVLARSAPHERARVTIAVLLKISEDVAAGLIKRYRQTNPKSPRPR